MCTFLFCMEHCGICNTLYTHTKILQLTVEKHVKPNCEFSYLSYGFLIAEGKTIIFRIISFCRELHRSLVYSPHMPPLRKAFPCHNSIMEFVIIPWYDNPTGPIFSLQWRSEIHGFVVILLYVKMSWSNSNVAGEISFVVMRGNPNSWLWYLCPHSFIIDKVPMAPLYEHSIKTLPNRYHVVKIGLIKTPTDKV